MLSELELIVVEGGGKLTLCAPDVGFLTDALSKGAALAPGQRAGTLVQLGRCIALLVPQGAAGVIVSGRPERVLEPVGYGAALFELEPHEAKDVQSPPAAKTAGALALCSPQAGRFYRRTAPDRAPFTEPGALLEVGQPVGLIEVMKTFTRVTYGTAQGLPPRGRVLKWLVEDGAEVAADQPLIEIEPA